MWNPRPVAAVALLLLLAIFLAPLLLLASSGDRVPQETPQPAPTATLPIQKPTAQSGAGGDGATLVRVTLPDGTVTALTLAEYLWRVVAAEMPASFETEALRAQAVTARTYTLYQMGIGQNPNHPDADMCTDISCCQAYLSPEEAAERWGDQAAQWGEKIARAVSDTDGQAILYEGEPIDAVFFSSAAGRTLDAVEVWGGSVPYLTSVESPEGEEVPNYRTRVTVGAEEFRETVLAAHPEADLSGAPEDWLGPAEHGGGGSVAALTVGGAAIPGTELRELFSLRSASFTLQPAAALADEEADEDPAGDLGIDPDDAPAD